MDADTRAALGALIRKERIAHLATLRAGAPMASMTLYLAAAPGGLAGTPGALEAAFYVHVSRLAWHTQDMRQDPRVALSIAESDDGRADPFTLMRLTVRGEALQLAQADPPLKDAWLARFPAQAINFTLADFSFWKITPRDARFVAGFGRIHNLSPGDLFDAAF